MIKNKRRDSVKTRRQMRTSTRRNGLRFSPTAWSKLLYLRDLGPTEVGGFGISAAHDLLLVEDVQLVRQHCSAMTVAFAGDAVAEFFDRQIDAGRKPAEFGRIWIHTHPGTSAEPSRVDEETFARVFGHSDWAVMAILACGGESYARLQFHVGPGGSVSLPFQVDFTRAFAGSDRTTWEREYLENVQTSVPLCAEWFDEPDHSHRTRDLSEDGEFLFFPVKGKS